MPKKKKKKSGTASKSPGKDKRSECVGSAQAALDREALLQREYEQLTNHLNELKRKAERLRQENEFLQQETHKTRMESQEYMAYMAKRTQKRQNAIITLSDQNHKQLEDIHRQREELLAEFNDRRTELKNHILEKEGELSKLNKDIVDLWECKHLQQEQMSRIKELEKEVMEMRAKHSESLQSIKARFLHEKMHNEKQSRQRVQALAVEASREASRCLVEHTHSIELENRQLRQELLHLIRKTQVLHAHQGELEEQRQQLLRERQYVEDLKRLRAQGHFHTQPPGGGTYT